MACMSKKQGGGAGNVGKLNNVLMQMRKVCNHPDLITGAFDGSTTYPSRQVGFFCVSQGPLLFVVRSSAQYYYGACHGLIHSRQAVSGLVPARALPVHTGQAGPCVAFRLFGCCS